MSALVEVPSASISSQSIHSLHASSSSGSSSSDELQLEAIISHAMDDAEFTMKMKNHKSERRSKRKARSGRPSRSFKSVQSRIRFSSRCPKPFCPHHISHDVDRRLFLEIDISALNTPHRLCAYFRLFPVYKHSVPINEYSGSPSPCSSPSGVSSPSLFSSPHRLHSRSRNGSTVHGVHHNHYLDHHSSVDDESVYDEIVSLKLCDFVYRQQLNAGFFVSDFDKTDFLEMMRLATSGIDVGDYDYYWIWHLLSHSISVAKPRGTSDAFGWVDSWTRYQHQHSGHHWMRCCRSMSTEPLKVGVDSKRTHSIRRCHALNRVICALYFYQNISHRMEVDDDCIRLQHRLKEYPYGDLSALHRDYKHIISQHHHDRDMNTLQFMAQTAGRLVQCDEEQCHSMRRIESESMKAYIRSMECMMDENEDMTADSPHRMVSYELMDLLHCCLVHQWSIRMKSGCQRGNRTDVLNIIESQSERKETPPKQLSRAMVGGSQSYSQFMEQSDRSIGSNTTNWSFMSRSGRRKSNSIMHMKYRIYF